MPSNTTAAQRMRELRRSRGIKPRKVAEIIIKVTLPPNANPRRLLVPRPDRRRACAHTNLCLGHAIVQGWDAFSCVDCEAFEPETPRSAENRRSTVGVTWRAGR